MTSLSLSCSDFHGKMQAGLLSMLETEQYANVTIAVEGKYLKAHQIVLSICSAYFDSLLQANPCKHPIIFMKGVKYHIMVHLLHFMYEGQTQIESEDFQYFIETAQELQIKWLTKGGNENDKTTEQNAQDTQVQSSPAACPIVEGLVPAEDTATGSHDIALRIKKEKDNDSTATITTSRNADMFSVEPIDPTHGLEAMGLDYLHEQVRQDCQTVKLESSEDNVDVVDLNFDDDGDGDELLQPMEQSTTTETSPSSTSITPVGQPVAVLYCKTPRNFYVVVHNYTYSRNHAGRHWTTFRCSLGSQHCVASVSLTKNKRIVFRGEHKHAPKRRLEDLHVRNTELFYCCDSSILQRTRATKKQMHERRRQARK